MLRHDQWRGPRPVPGAGIRRHPRKGQRHDPRGRVLLHPAEPVADAQPQPLDQYGVQLGEDREYHRRAPLQYHPATHQRVCGDRLHRLFEMNLILVERAYGPVVEGEALVSEEGFSPRYDLDRWSGLITRPGHRLEGASIVDKVCFFPTAKGGIAAGWAFYDIKWKKIAPKAFIFGV